MLAESGQASVWSRIPGLVRTIMVLQSIVIFSLSFWIYQEYQNNQYLQMYVNTSLQGTELAIIALASITGFSTVALILYKKLQRAQKELDEVLSNDTARKAVTRSPSILDQKTEQHLIDMIRAGLPPPAVQAGPTPVLRRAEDEDSSQ
jgi:uncharacterized membrane protein YcjF (UPF0283 family)